ncbi:MAG: YdcF family protein [bacterium]
MSRLFRVIMTCAGLLFLLFMLVGWLGLPRPFMVWLKGGDAKFPAAYRFVVVLGGAGIPSESGLMRTYHGAALARGETGVISIVALPCDQDPERGSVGKMRDELVMRGVSSNSVLLEYRGRNTHEQAANIARLLGAKGLTAPVVIVTTPPHLRRALLCFRHEGFRNVTGFAAVSGEVEADLGAHTAWRYGFWGNLDNCLRVLRELTALAQYWVKGWI